MCVITRNLKLHMSLAKKKAVNPGLMQVKTHTHSLWAELFFGFSIFVRTGYGPTGNPRARALHQNGL